MENQLNKIHEERLVLDTVRGKLPPRFEMYAVDKDSDEEAGGLNPAVVKFCYLCGVIKVEDDLKFRKMVFRMSRGNALSITLDPDHKYDDAHQLLDPLYDENVSFLYKIFREKKSEKRCSLLHSNLETKNSLEQD